MELVGYYFDTDTLEELMYCLEMSTYYREHENDIDLNYVKSLLNKNIPRYAQLCVGWWHCPSCGAVIFENSRYCYKCGQRVIIKGEKKC